MSLIEDFWELTGYDSGRNLIRHNLENEFGDRAGFLQDKVAGWFAEFLETLQNGNGTANQVTLDAFNVLSNWRTKPNYCADALQMDSGASGILLNGFLNDLRIQNEANWLDSKNPISPALRHEIAEVHLKETKSWVSQKAIRDGDKSDAHKLISIFWGKDQASVDSTGFAAFLSGLLEQASKHDSASRGEAINKTLPKYFSGAFWARSVPKDHGTGDAIGGNKMPKEVSDVFGYDDTKGEPKENRDLSLRNEVWWVTPGESYNSNVSGNSVDASLLTKELLGIFTDPKPQDFFGANRSLGRPQIYFEISFSVPPSRVSFYKPNCFSNGFPELWLWRKASNLGGTVRLRKVDCDQHPGHADCACATRGLDEALVCSSMFISNSNEVKILNAAYLSEDALSSLARPTCDLIRQKA